MQLNPRRAIITLLWAGSLILAGPAIGYAQGASERLSVQPIVSGQSADIAEYESAKGGVRDELGEYAN
jgi:hypothetical protein